MKNIQGGDKKIACKGIFNNDEELTLIKLENQWWEKTLRGSSKTKRDVFISSFIAEQSRNLYEDEKHCK